jgi:glutamate/tyrosine decarboxylase-like PLP-dependent enzyme
MQATDVLLEESSMRDVLAFVAREAGRYVAGLNSDRLHHNAVDAAAESFDEPLPERGAGALATVQRLADRGLDAAIRSSGPRFFHFVTGGTTPAALGADWLTSAIDQNNLGWTATPIGTQLEKQSIDWLKDLFGLPGSWGGVITTGATMANFTALACARSWWAERHGVDVVKDGFSSLPPVPVLSSGYIHPSALKALAMLGIGRATVIAHSRDATGRLDTEALESSLAGLGGAPAIVIANAGEVNAGDFDPIAYMADLAERYGAWLHVDGAFGLFAALSPRTQHLVEGVARAHSVIADGHKWLNVPYDCGFAFVADRGLFGRNFTMAAAYLPDPRDPRPTYMNLGPEASRRARSLPVWATLNAYGREGYRAMVERHLDLAAHIVDRVDSEPDLERLADSPLNIVCFRYRPNHRDEETLNKLNARLGEAVLEDGRVYVGTTSYRGKTAFRPAMVNWQTTEKDVDLLVEVILELGDRLRVETVPDRP